MDINEKITQYNNINEQIKELENQKKQLTDEIVEEMKNNNLEIIKTPDHLVATYGARNTIKYNNLKAIFDKLGDLDLLEKYTEVSIKTTAFNKFYKDTKNESLRESLGDAVTTNTSYNLTIRTEEDYNKLCEKLAKEKE